VTFLQKMNMPEMYVNVWFFLAHFPITLLTYDDVRLHFTWSGLLPFRGGILHNAISTLGKHAFFYLPTHTDIKTTTVIIGASNCRRVQVTDPNICNLSISGTTAEHIDAMLEHVDCKLNTTDKQPWCHVHNHRTCLVLLFPCTPSCMYNHV
jgi:hypothetical protein